MLFDELDVVRVTQAQSGSDPYTGQPVSVPAGQQGTVVVAGGDACDVEFFLRTASGSPHNAILIVDNTLLEPAQ